MYRHFQILWLLSLSVLLFSLRPRFLQAQDKSSDSPVFRSYHPPPDAPPVQESDALRQIWYAFLAARKANAGDAMSQQEMGVRYLYGKGVERDTAKAAYWMQKAADQGMTTAKFDVAILAFHGWGMPWDPFLSYRYLRETASHDMPEAQYFLASMLTENLVVPRSWAQAYTWMKKAADAGYKPAVDALPEFAERRAQEEAAKVVPATASAKSPKNLLPPSTTPFMLDFPGDTVKAGIKSLGDLVKGVGEEMRLALGLSDKPDSAFNVDSVTFAALAHAADAGSPEALTVLGRCSEKGLDTKKDSVAAAAYYIRAIRLDGPKAPRLLFKMLEQKSFQTELKARSMRDDPVANFVWAASAALGFDNVITPAQAEQMLKKSVDEGYVPALIEMGLWYYGGKWVDKDRERAMSLLRQAAQKGSRDAAVRLAVTTLREHEDEHADSLAVSLLYRAVPEGSLLAQVGLGYCYEEGIGVPKKVAEAARWYRAGAVRGSQDAYRALRRLYDDIRPPEKEFQVEED
jgi:TPR repeat protein